MTVQQWQVKLRQQAALDEHFGIEAVDVTEAPGEFVVTNPSTRRKYKVVYRGADSEWNYCSCLDFKTSRLHTCKHLEAVKSWLSNHSQLRSRQEPSYTSVYLHYGAERKVRIRIGSDHRSHFERLAETYFDAHHVLTAYGRDHYFEMLAEARAIDDTFRCYDDATAHVLELRERPLRSMAVEQFDDNKLDALLHTTLYPYQREGIRFAARTGHALIADEMGLGKTIQAIGAAEVLLTTGYASQVLVVCPTSLKYQWKREIERFTGKTRPVHVIEGGPMKRKEQYGRPEPYKIVSYNTACNDVKMWGMLSTDMLIMDEVQRLKNWKTQISIAARRIHSRYSVILSGTPLENKLEELYSMMELVDQYCLSPYYDFRQRYIITDEKGATVGYQNLNEIGHRLKPYMIRRRKAEVSLQLPSRMDQNVIIPITPEQLDIHEEYQTQVARIIFKWQKMHFLSEQDRQRLLMLLSMMRMVCDSTYILDQKTRYDTKVDEVISMVETIVGSGDEKVVIFSQWERMTRLVAAELEKRDIGYAYLHGGVPSAKRKDLVDNFTDDPACRVFLSTDAGSTGLNLQVASTIINLDLPWNPAVLEQRIGRIYRIGQQRNIQVYNLVAARTIEEQMIGKLRFKASMAEGVLDGGEDSIFRQESTFKQIMSDLETMMGSNENVEEEVPTVEANDTEPAAAPDEPASTERDMPDDDESPAETSPASHDTQEPDTSPVYESSTEKQEPPAEAAELVQQGMNFFSGLVATLLSPQKTAELVNTIVKHDEVTGQTSINIPVRDKDTVQSLLTVIGKLLG
ncbi:MAG: DEAD/DEAH box helicase family protein [Muribaculaceae bacterium]|nr:DEAD/DEAH box helicase family protein [Muribaculaceae bacterium]